MRRCVCRELNEVPATRYCPYLPDDVKLKPSRGLQPVAASRAQNCNAACADRGLRCHAPDFWFLNSCEKLAEYFPCEAGCALVLGGAVQVESNCDP